ncbi:MAG: PAS domain S-box protein [Myxococcales bacterium]|nr:PAS domain S-box protein [Myxococcales bacterium]
MDGTDEIASFLRDIIESVADPILVKDEDHRWIHCNRAFCEMMRLSREELLTKSDYELLREHEVENFRRTDDEVFASQQGTAQEATFTDPHGMVHTVSVKKSFFVGPEGRKMLVASIRDITEQRAAERREAELSKRLANSAKFAALGEMAGGIAHEINTPMAIILGLSDELLALAEDGEFTVEKVAQIHHDIEETVARISRIIKGLRAFARDGHKDQPQRVSLGWLVDQSLGLCEEKLRELGIELRVRVREPDTSIRCRPTQISQILLNLLNNARDAVVDHQPAFIELETELDERFAVIRVVDSGPGIDQKLRDRIMEPFFTTKPPGQGTGIGLSIARSLAVDNGGSLMLAEDHPRTCFVLRLPRADRERGAVAQ